MNLSFFGEIRVLKFLKRWRILASCFKLNRSGGVWLAQLVDDATLDVRVVSSSLMLDVKIFRKEKR